MKHEIKARDVFNTMKGVIKSHNLTMDTKMRLLKCHVFSVLLYGVETWILSQATAVKIQALVLWLYRRILGISRKKYQHRGIEKNGERSRTASKNSKLSATSMSEDMK